MELNAVILKYKTQRNYNDFIFIFVSIFNGFFIFFYKGLIGVDGYLVRFIIYKYEHVIIHDKIGLSENSLVLQNTI